MKVAAFVLTAVLAAAIFSGMGYESVVCGYKNTPSNDEVIAVGFEKVDAFDSNATRNDSHKYATTGKDLEAPVADAGPDQIVAPNTTVVLNGTESSDNIGIENYTWVFYDNGLQELYGIDPAYAFMDTGEYPVILNVTDTSGNWDMDNMTVIVDGTPPVVTEKVDKYYIDPQTDYFFVGNDTSINLTAVDDYAGVEHIYYGLDTDAFKYTGNISTTNLKEGIHTFRMGAEDNVGNWGHSNYSIFLSNIFMVDVTPPTVTAEFTGDHHVMSGTGNMHVRSNTTFVLSAEDINGTFFQSGVDKTWYSIDGKLAWGPSGRFDELMEGEHTFKYGAFDNIGNNCTAMEFTVLVNESSPLPPILRPATNRTMHEKYTIEGWIPRYCRARIVVNHNRTYITGSYRGNFSVKVLLDPGENIITACAVDYFGRLSPYTSPFTVVLDMEPPAATGMVPERNATQVPVDSNITVFFNEPLSELVISLNFYNETAATWDVFDGECDYVPWSLSAIYRPMRSLFYETRYRISVEMVDVAGNYWA